MAHASGPHRLLTIDQLSSRPGVPSLRRALSGRPPAARLQLLGSVSGDGLRPVDLSGKSARHRSLFGFVAGQAVSPGIPWQGGSLDAGGCERIAGLAYLCRLRAKADCHRTRTVRPRAHGRRSGAEPVCSGFDNHRSLSDAVDVIGAEAGEPPIGLFQSGGLGQAKFADQTVLASAPDAFDAALGLGRVGGDLLNAEFLESASQLGRRLFSGELFGQRPVGIVALEDAVAVVVEAEGDAMRGDHGLQGAKIAERIFGFELEVSGQDLTGGVILKADERELGAAAFEPVVPAGIGERPSCRSVGGAAGESDTGAAGASAATAVWRPARCGARSRG